MFKNFSLTLSVVLAIVAGQWAMPAPAQEHKAKQNQTGSGTKTSRLTKETKNQKKGHSAANRPVISIAFGKKLYKQYQCYDCHNIAGKGCDEGMKLDAIGSKRSKQFIREHIADPDKHFEKHPKAFETDLNLMPPQNLEPYEIDSLVEYLHSLK